MLEIVGGVSDVDLDRITLHLEGGMPKEGTSEVEWSIRRRCLLFRSVMVTTGKWVVSVTISSHMFISLGKQWSQV